MSEGTSISPGADGTSLFDDSAPMKALGKVALSISHEFNNLLQVLSCSIDHLKTMVTDPGAQRQLAMADDAIERGAKLAMELLTFSNANLPRLEIVNLASFAMSVWPLLSNAIGKQRTLDFVVRGTAGRVQADLTQLRVALLNLCLNARDATEIDSLILVEVGQFQEQERSFAYLAVRDHGRGMAAEVLARATEPFFTTKQKGGGTGLGLSTVRTVAISHGGHVRIDSKVGEGTIVKICLPVFCEPNERSLHSKPQVAAQQQSSQPRQGRILIVDDEEGISLWLTSILSSLGYTIKSTRSKMEASEFFFRDPAWPNLLLLDMTLSDGNGLELYQAFRQVRTNLPVLVCTGYGDQESIEKILDDGHELLRKPFTREEIEMAVARWLLA